VWVINIMMMLWVVFTVFRLATFIAFKPTSLTFNQCLPSFLLGLHYDLRWIALLVLPVVLFSIRPSLSPYYSDRNKLFWTWYLAVVIFIVLFFFIADFISFSYNETRLDAGAMNFVEDPGISLHMIWQTYPLVWILAGLVCALISVQWALSKTYGRIEDTIQNKTVEYRKGPFIIMAVVLAVFVYGRVHSKPLMWKDAFALKDGFKAYLALNPLQNFVATMRLRKPVQNESQARQYFPLIADFLQLSEPDVFSYKRTIAPRSGALESKPNVVLVICESFSMYKSTMSGNPLNTTPYFDSLCKQGIFFERCFSPHFSTARGLFAIITGIPDVQLFKFSTRNPAALNQNTIINNFEEYSKHYFLGGDPKFNNFEGLLQNIKELKLHTEENIHAPRLNVWGISDKDLFLAANDVFKKEKKPFFAIVQTSNNHRPYTIPVSDTDFVSITVSKDSLKKYGFESMEELNAFRYSDYCFKTFIETAKKEDYFHNTIFVFIGDHGVAGNADAVYPEAWTQQRLTDEHVPLLFYAPYLLEPQRRSETVSQIDVLPTIAGLLARPYVNTTLGRDLLHPAKKYDMAFITNTVGKIGVVTNEFYYTKTLGLEDREMVPVTDAPVWYSKTQADSIQNTLDQLTNAFYHTAQYLLLTNKQR